MELATDALAALQRAHLELHVHGETYPLDLEHQLAAQVLAFADQPGIGFEAETTGRQIQQRCFQILALRAAVDDLRRQLQARVLALGLRLVDNIAVAAWTHHCTHGFSLLN
ncbi:hypothetical protein D3C78_1722430 [compost metagenome]